MGLLTALGFSRRALVELRGLRRAAERVADALELQAGVAPRPGAQTFRGFSRERAPSDGKGTSVSYVDDREMARAVAHEQELRALLGRDPTAEELERTLAGDIE